MKLIIKKDQSKGMMGGTSFLFEARVKLTPDEHALVKKYNVANEVLYKKPFKLFGSEYAWIYTVDNLLSGIKDKCKDIGEILAREAALQEACSNFKMFIETMGSFGGEIVYEIDLPKEQLQTGRRFSKHQEAKSNQVIDIERKEELENANQTDDETEVSVEPLEYCYHCGEELKEQTKRCSKCGKRL